MDNGVKMLLEWAIWVKLDSKNVVSLGPKTFDKTRDTLSTKTNHWKSSKSRIMKISPKKFQVAPH